MGIVAVAHHFQNDVKEAEFEGVASVAMGSRQQEQMPLVSGPELTHKLPHSTALYLEGTLVLHVRPR